MTSVEVSSGTADLVVVGAGIVGLAHAYAAVRQGLSVVVIERDERARGASVRNFGHGCLTAQTGRSLEYGLAAREGWLALAKEAGVQVQETGTVVVARAEDEFAVLREFAAARGDQVQVLDESAVRSRVPVGDGVVGGAFLPLDIRVDPRQAVRAIAEMLAGQGVRFLWATAAHGFEPGEVLTSRGVVRGGHIVVAVGHDVDRHFPELATDRQVQRCSLHMLQVADPHGREIEPAVLTGFSLLRYDGFGVCPSLAGLRERLTSEHPELAEHGLNLMFTQLPGGDLTIGDTHTYARTHDPYRSERLDELVLEQTARLLGVPSLRVLERWRGVYASAPEPFLIEAPLDGVRVVSVTSGIGMTTALGLAPAVLGDLL